MGHTRRRAHRVARLVAIGAVVCGGVMVSQAAADGSPANGSGGDPTRVLGARDTRDAELARTLVDKLGTSRTAGSWIGSDGRAVVAVTDAEAADQVNQAGARAKQVRYSMRQLRSATETLRKAPRVAGTAWAVDATSNEVVVLGDSSVSADQWSRMKGVASAIGGEVRMERTAGSFTTRTLGAEPIFTQGGRCSAGFNVTNGQAGFILTAGHCGPNGTAWFADTQGNTTVGTTVRSDFPGSDFSLVQYQNTSLDQSSVLNIGNGQTVRITGAADPVVGQKVFRSGSTSGLRTGSVTALNATVNYPEGTVSGLIQTDVCAEPGDSGGPLFAQNVALGVTSGGTGDCTSGGVTFFQPVTKAMTALGVSLPNAPASDGDGEAAGTASTAPNNGSDPAAQGAAGGPGGAGGAGGQGGQVSPIIPGTQGDTSSLAGVVAYAQSFGPGLALIGAGLLGFLATLLIRPGRRGYRGYSTRWG
ncbi:S1 family peptidase [Streptomyces milbemycinicus]|uniref:S1 family peptidase n=1 Tax=Streptomyces milbemycinicus TaxID=476552 RepID=UPI00340C18DE